MAREQTDHDPLELVCRRQQCKFAPLLLKPHIAEQKCPSGRGSPGHGDEPRRPRQPIRLPFRAVKIEEGDAAIPSDPRQDATEYPVPDAQDPAVRVVMPPLAHGGHERARRPSLELARGKPQPEGGEDLAEDLVVVRIAADEVDELKGVSRCAERPLVQKDGPRLLTGAAERLDEVDVAVVYDVGDVDEPRAEEDPPVDRKSTRLNSSH